MKDKSPKVINRRSLCPVEEKESPKVRVSPRVKEKARVSD